ncbi:MAG: hypothetical protein A2312_03465 [Candidatus Staskawiczbacteria bacterium RIFOXYB2_FULL_32_9]|uniref:Helix-turn-helix domain-containing protein n=1 Tax=Candidatus Staskawiczbacteria bacterium RIFOXYD1_FULL_32_13 TaxID=1802234 RepID=A0A1G2JMN2_9BACT|nr:MAG: hypothetical protein A2256_03125 [Candidatus Staskawiczbacteria bacterium RIFOXYA2_FULL_32_7]OGZ83318.1 MAG: hypothetical protein A2312_03465 [Candidatus Staskawiczbacteria bacterium RIFOXYB2_FULL_32_9]OGZ88369.1 MAG: hypothetical protein A2561_02100 [Candidatus Staskawiczbacteria bacterium RIFOXYD1_FULL_32_13]
MKYFMKEQTRQFSQLWDDGIKSGIVGKIGTQVFALLVVLAPFMNERGECYPTENTLAFILHKSIPSIIKMVSKAKKTIYNGEAVLKVRQQKRVDNGKILWGSNFYTISKSIRSDLLSRYVSVDKNLSTENKSNLRSKTLLPPISFPPTEEVSTNDSRSLNHIFTNDNKKSLININGYNEISLMEFRKTIKNEVDMKCYEIAEWLGEKNINFILSALNDNKCGMHGIEHAYRKVKDYVGDGNVKSKPKLFNWHIQNYKKGKR